MRQEVPATKRGGVVNQVVEIQADGGVVRGNHRARADADDRVDSNALLNQPSQNADMSGTAQPARAQNETDAKRPVHAATSAAVGSTRESD